MRVVCDNCGATYKIPEHKLRKEVNKATCRKCGHRMLIRKTSPVPVAGGHGPKLSDERTLVTSAADIERKAREQAEAARANLVQANRGPDGPEAWGDDAPTQVQPPPQAARPVAQPRPVAASIPAPAAPAIPPPVANPAAAPLPTPRPAPYQAPLAAKPPAAAAEPTRPRADTAKRRPAAFDPGADLTWALLGAFGAIAGVLLLAANFGDHGIVRFLGVLFAMGGALTALFVLVTGNRGRRPAGILLSLVLAVFFSVVGAGGVHLAHVGVAGIQGLGQDGAQSLTLAAEAAATKAAAARAAQEAKAAKAKAEAEAEAAAAEDGDALADADGSDDAGEDGEDADADADTDAADNEDAEVPSDLSATTTATTSGSSGSSSGSSGSSSSSPTRGSGTDLVSGSSSSGSSSGRSTSSGSSSGASSSRSSGSSSGSSSSGSSSRSSGSSSGSSSRSSDSSSGSSGRSSGSSSGSSSRSSGSSSSSRSSTPAPRTEAPIPITVIDTMMRNNSGVKQCFVDYKAANGSFPSRVEVKLSIQNTGRVSSARVVTSQYANTDLDSCLGSAVRGINFPPFDGEPFAFKYPFVL